MILCLSMQQCYGYLSLCLVVNIFCNDCYLSLEKKAIDCSKRLFCAFYIAYITSEKSHMYDKPIIC